MNINSEERKDLLKEFLEKYDPSHSLSFNGVKFRPGAKRTTGFGIDTTTTQYTPLRIHLAIDSARSNSTGYKIFAPFDIERTEYYFDYGSFGTLLFLYTKYGFHIRIAHIEKTSFGFESWKRIESEKGYAAGEFIAECGNEGLSFGRHAHVEIVSNGNEFTILDDIIKEKFQNPNMYNNYSEEQINQVIDSSGLDRIEGWKLYESEYKRRKIKILNDYIGYRVDYHTQEDRMFYNSMAVFGM